MSEYPKELSKLKGMFHPKILDLLSDLNCILAGGAITSMFTNREVNDLDVYFPSKEAFTTAMKEIFNEGLGEECLYDISSFAACANIVTKKAVLFKSNGNQLQFIAHRFYSTSEEIFNDFDFTACMGAVSLKDNTWTFHKDFFKHNSQRYIQFNPNTSYPIISALRLKKYQDKGYNVGKAQFLRVMLAINNKNIDSWDKLIDELSGMYGTKAEDIFDTTKPFNLEEALVALDNVELKEIVHAQSWTLEEVVEAMPEAFTEQAKEFVRKEKEELHKFGLNSRLNW